MLLESISLWIEAVTTNLVAACLFIHLFKMNLRRLLVIRLASF